MTVIFNKSELSMKYLHRFYVDRRELEEHGQTVHLLGCGICGEMYDTRDGAKTCFFFHLVYIRGVDERP